MYIEFRWHYFGSSRGDEVNKGTSNVGGKSEMGAMMEVLTNMAVAGAAYLTSSGTAGATDEKGISKRNHRGTVELRLGSLIIGKIKAVHAHLIAAAGCGRQS